MMLYQISSSYLFGRGAIPRLAKLVDIKANVSFYGLVNPRKLFLGAPPYSFRRSIDLINSILLVDKASRSHPKNSLKLSSFSFEKELMTLFNSVYSYMG